MGIPPTALATLNGHFRGHPRRDPVGRDNYGGRFKIRFIKKGDQWLVTSVDHSEAGHAHK